MKRFDPSAELRATIEESIRYGAPMGPLFQRLAPFSDPDTSREAARVIEPHLERLEAVVLAAIRDSMPLGLTDQEIEARTGLQGSTERPRRRALELRGLIVALGTRKTGSGRAAKVWVAR